MARDPIGAVVRNLFGLQRMGTSITRLDVEPLIDDLFDDIAAKIARLDPTAPDRESFRRARLEKLVGEVESLVGSTFKEVRRTVETRLAGVGEQQAAWAARGLAEWLPEIDTESPRLGRSFFRAILKDDPFEGETLKGWVEEVQSPATVRRVRRALQLGMAENETIDDMIRRVRGRSASLIRQDPATGQFVSEGGRVVGRRFSGGILQTTTREAEAIVRTGVNHIANRGHMATYAENADVLSGLLFTATLDSRTSEICMALDGEVLDVEGPDPSKTPPRHINCRSVLTPIIGWDELGLEEPPEATRASADGQVSASTTYEGWLRDQSAAEQDEILGPGRAKLFRAGKIGIKDLITKDQRIVPLKELLQD